jgi:hypothetical protein
MYLLRSYSNKFDKHYNTEIDIIPISLLQKFKTRSPPQGLSCRHCPSDYDYLFLAYYA